MKSTLAGFGRTSFIKTNTFRPEYLSDLQSILKINTSCISRGCGRSYGDEALTSHTTILLERLNRFISFDPEKLVLICESGITLRDIQHTFLPKNSGLITSPGTAFVTLGGAIANDVHGKNHESKGSFSRSVLWFDLLLSSGEIIRCSRTENNAIFFATIGGLGLTGIITTVCLQLQQQSNTVSVTNEFITTIPALFFRLRAVRDQSTYSVAWLDLATKHFGRSILSTAERSLSLEGEGQGEGVSISSKVFLLASLLLNRFTIRIFNMLYFLRASKKPHTFTQSLYKFLYPLDTLSNWNYLYGKSGFYQFQCVIPDDSAESGITDILNAVRNSKHICYLAILKTLGADGEGLLSFAQKGFTLALDFPARTDIVTLLKQLEAITVKHNGRIYLAKDACLHPENFSKMYHKLPAFRDILNKIDPQQRWRSELSRRLKI